MSRVRDNNDKYIYMVRETLKSTCSCILQLHVYPNTMLIYVDKNHTLAKAMINVYNIFTVCVQTDTVLIMLA